MKNEKSEFEILVSNPSTFQAISRYSEGLRIIERLKLNKSVSTIRSRQALDWQLFIAEHEGPLYSAVLNGWNFGKVTSSFELGKLNMSLETLGKIMRERKPMTFEEVVIWSAIYCDLAHRETPAEGYQIGESIEKYAQWLYRVNNEFGMCGIPYNYIDDSALVADNVKFVYFVEA